MAFYPPTESSDWASLEYSTDVKYSYLLFTSFWRCLYECEQMLRPHVADSFNIYKDLRYQFVDHIDDELAEYGAVGLATRDWNKVYVPAGCSPLQMQAISGTMSMELMHSVWKRIFHHEDTKGWNDVIHYLYNEGRLLVKEYRSTYILQHYGTSIKVVVPDMDYAVVNRKSIMEGIRSGRYIEGRNEYWGDPAVSREYDKVLLHKHELGVITNWINHGCVYGMKASHTH